MSFASFPALTASGISRCRIRIDIEAPEIILSLQLYLLSEEEEEEGEEEGEEKVFDEAAEVPSPSYEGAGQDK